MRFLTVFAAIAVAVLAAVSAAAAPPEVWMVDLGTLSGRGSSWATAINNSGQVVGYSHANDICGHAFLWTRGRGMVDLTPGSTSSAADINDNGQVVGALDVCGTRRPFLWQSGRLTKLPGLGSDSSFARADAVNELGQVVGLSETRDGDYHAFFWTRKGGIVDIGTLGGGYSDVVDINDSGQVVGQSVTRDGADHGFFWTREGGMVDLGTLGGRATRVVDINNSGQVVGDSETRDDDHHGFFWTRESGMVDLGTLGGTGSIAAAVNDRGQVVGDSSKGNGDHDSHAFVWTREDGMVGLDIPGWCSPDFINNNGQVVGTCVTRDSSSMFFPIFSWTPAGGMINLGTLGGDWARAAALNDRGQIVGTSYIVDGNRDGHAFLVTRAPWMRIPPLD